MMETENINGTFENLDAEKGVALFEMVGMGAEDVGMPGDSEKLAEIARFADKFQDGISLLRRVTLGRKAGEKNLDRLHRYVTLQYSKMEIAARLRSIDEEISMYE